MNSPPTISSSASHARAVPRLLSIKQAMYELRLGRTKLYELIADGKLKTVTVGRRRYVTVETIYA
jgi:excisionase family DNA binding protein